MGNEAKIFIWGLTKDTTEEMLMVYFGNYGEVLDANIVRYRSTKQSKKYGFVLFAEQATLDRVLEVEHVIRGKKVHVQRSLSREESYASALSRNLRLGRLDGGGGEGGNVPKKIFVGGLSSTLTEDKFLQHFQQYGVVTDTLCIIRRGFGFVTYSNEDAVERALHEAIHEIDGKRVEVKRFNPKHGNLNSDSGGRSEGRGYYDHRRGPGGHSVSYDGIMDASRYDMQPQTAGGGYPSYGMPRPPYGHHSLSMGYCDPYLGGSGAYCGTYDGRMDTNRYDMQPQTAGGGYPSYGSSDYGMPSYQYGLGGYARPSSAQGNPSARTGGDAGYGSATIWNTQPLATTSAGSYDGRIETNRYHVPPQIAGDMISNTQPESGVSVPASTDPVVTGYMNSILRGIGVIGDRRGGALDSNQAGDANESSGNSRA